MTRRETRRTRRVRWLAALLGAFVLALSVMPVTASAAPEANSLAEAYVSANGKDETADGTQDLPFASLKEAVLAVQDGGTVYVMNDLTISKMAYVDGKSVTVDGDGHVVRRSDEFEKSQDLNRGGFNAGMFEVANEGTLRLKDITLDDAMLHEGTEFVEEKTGQDVPDNVAGNFH